MVSIPRITSRGNNSAHPSKDLKAPPSQLIERCMVFIDGLPQPGPYDQHSALVAVREHNATIGPGEPKAFMWLSLGQPTEQQMTDIADGYGVHELIVEDAVSAHQRPKLERYDDQLFMVIRSVFYKEHESVVDAKEIIQTGERQMIISPEFIITVRHGPSPMKTIKQRIEHEVSTDPETFIVGPMAIAWFIADSLVDEYLRISTELSGDVDELESEVFSPDKRFDIEQIYMLKREILEMRHAIDPLAIALRLLIQNNKDVVDKEIRSYYRDVLDHELIAADQIASYDERLSSLLDAGVAMISLQQNADMRQISALVGMAAVPTMIAGIYGMNFDNMPELHTQYGYFVVLFVMAAITVGVYWAFKRNHWL